METTNAELQTRNLNALLAEMHQTGKAAKGLLIIQTYLEKNDHEGLAHLLRYHIPDGVYDEELKQRFKVDALIEFYNLLTIAALCAYVPLTLNPSICAEIKTILELEAVKKYYTEFYPYEMTHYTLQFVKGEHALKEQAIPLNTLAFFNLLTLHRQLKKDKAIERFLGMLDSVNYDTENLSTVINTLKNQEELTTALSRKISNENDTAIWGFIKFVSFLNELTTLLESVASFPPLQSAIWLFYGYYLDHLNTHMKSIMNEAFGNLQIALSNSRVFNAMSETNTDSLNADSLSQKELNDHAATMIENLKANLIPVLNTEHRNGIKPLFKQG